MNARAHARAARGPRPRRRWAALLVLPALLGVAVAQTRDPLAAAPVLGGAAWGASLPYRPALRPDLSDGGAPLWVGAPRPGQQPDGRVAPLPRPGREAPVYALDLRLSADGATLEGDAEVLVPNTSDTLWRAVVFQLPGALLGGRFTFTSTLVDGEPVVAEERLGGRALRLPLDRPMLPGDAVVVRLAYRLGLPGPSAPGHAILTAGEAGVSLAHAYPLLARFDGPGPHPEGAVMDGFDLDPPAAWGDLAASVSGYYRVRLELPADWQVALPVPDAQRETEGGTQVLRFAFGPARDLYLAAAPSLVSVESQVGAVRVRVLLPPELADAGRDTLDVARTALSVYEGRYGAYPYAALTLVATPTTALGMEFPGIIALNASLFEADADPQLRAGVVAHEVAHQWFYGVLGDDQISQPWVDEALAQLATWGYFAERGGAAAAGGFQSSLEARWQRERGRDIPVGMPVEAYSATAYGAIVYGRAPLELGALRRSVGPERFDGALRVLVGQYRFGVVSARELVAGLELGCGCDLAGWAEDVVGPGPWPTGPGTP